MVKILEDLRFGDLQRRKGGLWGLIFREAQNHETSNIWRKRKVKKKREKKNKKKEKDD